MFHRDLMACFPVSEHHFFPVNFRSGKRTSHTLRLCWEKCTQHVSLHRGRQNYSIPRMSCSEQLSAAKLPQQQGCVCGFCPYLLALLAPRGTFQRNCCRKNLFTQSKIGVMDINYYLWLQRLTSFGTLNQMEHIFQVSDY